MLANCSSSSRERERERERANEGRMTLLEIYLQSTLEMNKEAVRATVAALSLSILTMHQYADSDCHIFCLIVKLDYHLLYSTPANQHLHQLVLFLIYQCLVHLSFVSLKLA